MVLSPQELTDTFHHDVVLVLFTHNWKQSETFHEANSSSQPSKQLSGLPGSTWTDRAQPQTDCCSHKVTSSQVQKVLYKSFHFQVNNKHRLLFPKPKWKMGHRTVLHFQIMDKIQIMTLRFYLVSLLIWDDLELISAGGVGAYPSWHWARGGDRSLVHGNMHQYLILFADICTTPLMLDLWYLSQNQSIKWERQLPCCYGYGEPALVQRGVLQS